MIIIATVIQMIWIYPGDLSPLITMEDIDGGLLGQPGEVPGDGQGTQWPGPLAGDGGQERGDAGQHPWSRCKSPNMIGRMIRRGGGGRRLRTRRGSYIRCCIYWESS